MPKNWKIRVNDNERYWFSGLNAIPILKYRSLKKIDWASSSWLALAELALALAGLLARASYEPASQPGKFLNDGDVMGMREGEVSW